VASLRGSPRGPCLAKPICEPAAPVQAADALVRSLRGSFNAFRTPYFRFEFKSTQHRTLVRLDEASSDQALVRYAAPCSARRTELEQWQIDRAVLDHTNFVSPRRIGLRHKAWTYISPGQVGYRNEFTGDDDALASDSADSIFANLADRPQAPRLNQHVSAMLRGVGGATADAIVEDVIGGVQIANGDSVAALAAATRLRLVGLEFGAAGLSWWLRETG
jgi:hypothetical protein